MGKEINVVRNKFSYIYLYTSLGAVIIQTAKKFSKQIIILRTCFRIFKQSFRTQWSIILNYLIKFKESSSKNKLDSWYTTLNWTRFKTSNRKISIFFKNKNKLTC